MDWITRLASYANACLAQPLGYPDCNALWGGLFLAVISLAGIVALRVIYKNQHSHREEQRIIEEIIRGRRRAADAFASERDTSGKSPSAADGRYAGQVRGEADHKDAFP